MNQKVKTTIKQSQCGKSCINKIVKHLRCQIKATQFLSNSSSKNAKANGLVTVKSYKIEISKAFNQV